MDERFENFMDINEFFADQAPQPNPRRKTRDPKKEFWRTYGPLILVAIALIAFLFFAAGSLRRSREKREAARQESLAIQQSSIAQQVAWDAEAQDLMARASVLAAGYDYDAAIALLDTFSGSLYEYDDMATALESWQRAKESLVAWEDPGQVVNLSFNLLIADPGRAFSHEKYGASFARSFITVSEFTNILTQLYENDFVLVDLSDIVEVTEAGGNRTYSPKTLYLPEGKKPLLLTQTHVNYNTYMIDSDGDGLADKGGAGFASRLILDANGQLTCEMVDKSGNTVTGAYDMVPILNTFLKTHPDFSYQGARAILAVSGYDGLFGYRTDPETVEKLGQEYYDAQCAQLPEVLAALRRDGYTIACYTYGNLGYGNVPAEDIAADLASWEAEVTPLLGETDILVYAKESEISSYESEDFRILYDAGFRYYLSFGSESWLEFRDGYVRQGRLLIHGANLERNGHLYTGLFDAASVLDPSR